MKTLMTVMLLSLSMMMYSQGGKSKLPIDTGIARLASVAGIPDSAKVTFSKVYTDVKAGLTGLGSALKVGAEHVYVVLIKQQIVNGVTDLIGLILMVVAFVIIFKFFMSRLEFAQGEDADSEVLICMLSGMGSLVLGIAIIVMCTTTLTVIVTAFINPEYGAIKEIMSFVQ